MIAILHNTELNQYGFEGEKFRRLTRDRIGGYEWGGPCPVCGGKDRCIVSNGMYWCRHSNTCGFTGTLVTKTDIVIDPEKQRLVQIAVKEEEARVAKKQEQKIANLNRSKIWKAYHQALLDRPEMVERLENDGISLQAINRYQLGFAPSFNVYDHNTNKFKEVPAFSFPHFSMIREDWCLNIRMRILDTAYAENVAKYLPYRANLPTLFFNAFCDSDREEIVIIEGEKKAIVLQEHGIPAVGLWGIYALKAEWVPWFTTRFRKRYLVYDADNWGVIQATYHQSETLKAKPVFLNIPGKVDDLLVSGQLTADEFMKQVRE